MDTFHNLLAVFSKQSMSDNCCDVCESPSVSTLHFGGRCCKACAAFFRRTVSMDVKYECVNGGLTICRIHHELRMVCRQCRFLKCLRAGMNRDLVQNRREEDKSAKEAKKRKISVVETVVSPDPSECPPSTSDSPGTSYQSPGTTPGPSEESGSQEEDLSNVIDQYIKLEASLNDRRRMMYTDVPMRDVFKGICKCPYEQTHLRPFNYRTFIGYDRADFIMIYDYARGLPGFDSLTENEKNEVFRFCCGVDCMINSAYYTACLGRTNSRLVIFNGEYLNMNPLPMTGEEKDASKLFETTQDFVKYKSIMPTKLRQWQNMAIPFINLEASFEEFALLKALTIWQSCYFKLSENGQKVCVEQRNLILLALRKLCIDQGKNAPERVGNLVLSMSYVLEQVHELINSFVMITFFDIFKCDSKTVDCLDFAE